MYELRKIKFFAMWAFGVVYTAIGFFTGDQSFFVIANVWLVGSILIQNDSH